MTIGKMSLLTLGFVGTFALGVAVGPAVLDRMDRQTVVSAPPVVQPTEPATPIAKSRPSPSARAKAAVEARETVPAVAASEPELHARLKPVLNRGAKMSVAAEGFRDAEQFATVAHAARNTDIPFMVLKHRVLNEGQSLANAIRASKPGVDARAAVERARTEARADVAGLGN
jgi:hypothetical protein